ncbi:hypothetical protein [Spirulina major]|nr:hypothetical protein [Spirulina major]
MILQLLMHHSCQPTDLQALRSLTQAIEGGKVERESLGTLMIPAHLGVAL